MYDARRWISVRSVDSPATAARITIGPAKVGRRLTRRFASDEGEDGEHAPVVVGRRRQSELVEDVAHVLLDRAVGDHQLRGDRMIRTALGHQLEDLALARGQGLERILPPA